MLLEKHKIKKHTALAGIVFLERSMKIKIKIKKPRNQMVIHVVKRKAGKHKDKKREAKNRGYDE